MSCNGCFNGCVDITSDQCVKYTGDPIVAFGIETGMPMSEVTEKITEYLLEVLEGTGVEPTLPAVICDLVHDYLPEGDATLNDVIEALINAACDLQTQVDGLSTILDGIEASYTIGCLTGVTAASGTHNILQAVITKLCFVADQVTALQAALSQYVKIADLDGYIQDYLDTIAITAMYNKMVPYVAVEYYGPVSGYPTGSDGFDINGVGYGAWEQVYLCNGYNGLTPDKKGRIPIGCTSMGGAAFNVAVDPADPRNPTYTTVKQVEGANFVTLSKAQMPIHNHLVDTPVVTDPGHRHLFFGDPYAGVHGLYTKESDLCGGLPSPHEHDATCMGNYYTKSEMGVNTKSSQTTGISVSVNVLNDGGGLSHSNIPPVMSCYYIMYVPNP
jgi:microcystin-dependent protein